MMRTRVWMGVAALALASAARPAAAREPLVVLRMATVAPAGTAWAREGHALERDIEELTHGAVKMKWYLGGIAGDEMQMLDRVRRDQLDGIASGGMLCQKLSPSMRALRFVGLFQNRDESSFVSGRLQELFDAEFAREGFQNLGEYGVGPDVIFSRTPIRTMDELKRARLWIWDLDVMFGQALTQMGLSVVPRPLEGAYAAFESGAIDGFVAVPTAALAFQWSTEVRYFTDLRPSFLRGCMLIASRAYDQLSVEGQQAVRQATARAIARLEEVGRAQDDALLGGLFARQGLKPVDPSEAFRAEFYAAARATRERMGEQVIEQRLLQRVLTLLADFRAFHHGGGTN
jgi:TRAP-type C4-dicarboxylate transport system substrate-binding protein